MGRGWLKFESIIISFTLTLFVPSMVSTVLLVSRASLLSSACSTDRFQYRPRADTESDRCCGRKWAGLRDYDCTDGVCVYFAPPGEPERSSLVIDNIAGLYIYILMLLP